MYEKVDFDVELFPSQIERRTIRGTTQQVCAETKRDLKISR